MANSSARVLTYAAAQAARVAFYGAHYLAARLMAHESFSNIPLPEHPMPSLADTLTAIRDLFVQDWKNVEAGLYPAPVNIAAELRSARASALFLADVPKVVSRQKRHAHDEVRPHANGLPRYYQQNFHFQTGGYLSEESARLYDFQVEALFAGTADAMRRRAFVPIAEYLDRCKIKKPVLLDIGAGTGGFLSFAKAARRPLKAIALDLSEPYLARARRRLVGHKDVKFLAAPAENMPLPDASVDAAVSIFVFHELPPKVRSAVAKEIARVLKPGGVFVLADTIQHGDAPAFEGLIEVFPSLLYEPYYSSYAKMDLDKLFATAGLSRTATDIAYLTKIAVFEKRRSTAKGRRD